MSNKRNSITINFKPEFSHLYEFIQRKDNKSAYVLRLIEQDMKQSWDTHDLKTEVIKILNEFITSNAIVTGAIAKDQEGLSGEDVDLINEFF